MPNLSLLSVSLSLSPVIPSLSIAVITLHVFLLSFCCLFILYYFSSHFSIAVITLFLLSFCRSLISYYCPSHSLHLLSLHYISCYHSKHKCGWYCMFCSLSCFGCSNSLFTPSILILLLLCFMYFFPHAVFLLYLCNKVYTCIYVHVGRKYFYPAPQVTAVYYQKKCEMQQISQ